jgi:hypothetical protein
MNVNFEDQILKKTNDELLDIFLNSDHYQRGFVELAVQELDRRKVDITSYKQQKQHDEVLLLEQMEEGEPGNPIWITLGFISTLLGGLIGIVAGYVYSQSRNKELGDGNHYYYDLKTRTLGYGMMLLGITVFIFTIVLRAAH